MIKNFLKYLAVIAFLLSILKINGQTDTLYLSLRDCHHKATEQNISIKISDHQFVLAKNLKKSAKTKYFGNFNLIGRYQYTNNQFRLMDDNLFVPVVPFWAIDQETMDLNENIMDNPLYHGIVSNPFTGETYTDTEGNPLFFFYSYLPANQMQIGHNHNYVFGPSFIQPIYLGGKIQSINKIAAEGVAIARSNYNIEKNEIYYEVQENYWTIVNLQEKEKLAKSYITFLDTLLYDLNNMHNEGLITYHEILGAKVKLNEVQLNLTKIQHGMDLAKMYLKHLTGIPSGTKIVLTDNLDNMPLLPNPEGIEESAIQNREEINILQSTKNIAIANQDLAKSRFLPNISLSANYLFMNPNPFAGLTKGIGHDYTIGINVQIPLFSWGDRLHTLRASENLIHITELKKQETESLIKLEINKTWKKYKEAVKEMDLRKNALKFANKNLELYQDMYDEGMITSVKLIQARAEKNEVFSELVETKTKIKTIEIEYRKKLGLINSNYEK